MPAPTEEQLQEFREKLRKAKTKEEIDAAIRVLPALDGYDPVEELESLRRMADQLFSTTEPPTT